MAFNELDHRHMRRALDLAALGQGRVEPNPMVGCVIADGETVLAEGWHQEFGGDHAEVNALAQISPQQASTITNSTSLYVTLEPCCHRGKTPPCTDAIIQSGIRRVVVAMTDPFAKVSGRGVAQLREAGVDVSADVLANEARELNAPYLKRIESGQPWVIAKWAMTLDGKLATYKRQSQWISNAQSRERVHQLRGRMDAIAIGVGTVLADDPRLTARPSGPRVALRVVLDDRGELPLDSLLLKTINEAPLLVVVGPSATKKDCQLLIDAGCELFQTSRNHAVDEFLGELSRRNVTNLLVEGGAAVFGSFFDQRAVDEVHVFLAPKIVGGQQAVTPVTGVGIGEMIHSIGLQAPQFEVVGEENVYVHGRLDPLA